MWRPATLKPGRTTSTSSARTVLHGTTKGFPERSSWYLSCLCCGAGSIMPRNEDGEINGMRLPVRLHATGSWVQQTGCEHSSRARQVKEAYGEAGDDGEG